MYNAERNEGMVWVASGINLAQLLCLHNLGNDQAVMPPWGV